MTNKRARLITAGLLAAAALALPACSTNVTPGTPVASSTERAEYRAEQARERMTTPAKTDTPVERGPVVQDSIPASYQRLSDLIASAVAEANAFWTASGVSLDAEGYRFTDMDYAVCDPELGSASMVPAWTCPQFDGNVVAFYLPMIADSVEGNGGTAAVFGLVGHELSHYGLPKLDARTDTSDSLEELRADCAAGAFVSAAAKRVGFDGSTAVNAINSQSHRDAFNYGFQSPDVSRCVSYQG